MPVKQVAEMIDFLGPEGAKQGLMFSLLTNDDLKALLGPASSSIGSRATREELCNEIAYLGRDKIEYSKDKLLAMSSQEILEHLRKSKPTFAELERILKEIGVRVSSESRRDFYKFFAQEIGDMGMFERVAKGSSKKAVERRE